ncbi:helix-turn-helix domain-containing protein [Oscillospiraceae bacterium OttesenSCG-928-F05]|nr:helix-turn-helix domain-containing protein [Oscillospiraceae bacterium OttesenSCG-928-F05]
MAIGERIKHFRNMRGLTQKQLGVLVGFSEKNADVRMAQYESGTRTPKNDLVEALAHHLEVSPLALTVPDIDTEHGLMHTLYALEDLYGLEVQEINGRTCLSFKPLENGKPRGIHGRMKDWNREAEKLKSGEITVEDYNAWRYTYPELQLEREKDARRKKDNK